MNEMQKYFPRGVDGLLDDAIKAIVKPFENSCEFVDFLVFVMSMVGMRRIKFLFCPDEMSEEERKVPEFKLEVLPFLTDEEIKAAFYLLSPMDKAKFVMSVRKADGPVATRFDALLEQMKSGEQAAQAANHVAIERRAQEEADRARQAAEEAESKRVRRDDEALKFITQAPDGRFQVAADLDATIDIEDDTVFDWVNRKEIPVGDAMVVGKCLITNKTTAERLAEKLRRPQDKQRPLAFTIAQTREWLAQCEKEYAAARNREAEEKRVVEAEQEKFVAEVREAFAAAPTLPDKELVRNWLKSEADRESWKLGVIRREAEAREQVIFEVFRQDLRRRFQHSSAFAELDAYIMEMEAKFFGRASDEGWADNVIKGAEREVNIARRHGKWLEDNPAGVRQQADIIDFADRWESSADRRERPKFGPGSGIGGVKKEKTQEERLVHRGRQLAFGDRRYWEQKFNKTVEKFTDEDFKRVVEIFGDVKGDRKAAKKKSGGKKG